MGYPHLAFAQETHAEHMRRKEAAEAQIDRLAREVTGNVPQFLLDISVARMGVSDLRDFLEAYEELRLAHVGLDANEVTTDRLEAAFVTIRDEMQT